VEHNLSNEIVSVLIRGDLHPRGIAQTLGNNHTSIARKLNDLLDGNVVDYRFEGKNKVYFLKRTIEARNAIIAAELHRQSTVLKAYPLLRGIFYVVQESHDINLAIIFGSYAKGLAHAESDIDLFIETSSEKIKGRVEKTNSLLSAKIGKFEKDDLIAREMIKDHVIIKGIEIYLDRIGFLRR